MPCSSSYPSLTAHWEVTVSHCVIRLSDPRLNVNSGQALLSPTGSLALFQWAGLCNQCLVLSEQGSAVLSLMGPSGSALSRRTAASLWLQNKAGMWTKGETSCIQLLWFQLSSDLTYGYLLERRTRTSKWQCDSVGGTAHPVTLAVFYYGTDSKNCAHSTVFEERLFTQTSCFLM